jgi:hypothetical protein
LAGPSIETTHIEEKADSERPAKKAKGSTVKAQTPVEPEAKAPVESEDEPRSSLADALGDAFAENA